MKRRAFIRTVTGLFSAAVFTSAGWLMGTRTLTMGAQMPPPPTPADCFYYCTSARNCESNTGCSQAPHCNTADYYWYSTNGSCPVPYNCFVLELRGICDCTPCREP